MATKNIWHNFYEEKPKEIGTYWIYLPSYQFQSGVMFGYWDGFEFDHCDDNNLISHFTKVVRPAPPRKSK
jgi:hypothetical protein